MAKAAGTRKLSAKNIAAGFLMAILALSLLGFGVEGFGGSTRSVGKVGDRDLTTAEYGRALQNELRALQAQFGQTITMEQARLFGLDRMVLEQLITQAVLDNEAARLGLSVGDTTVQREILQIPAFQGLSGTIDREAYRFALQNAGLTEREFETSIRRDVARSILQLSAVAGSSAPDVVMDLLLDYQAQTRDFSVLTLGPNDLQDRVGFPDQDALQAWYDANIDRYTLPEGKRINYAWLTPDMLADQIEPDEASLRMAYDARIAEFRQPERRLVERLVFADRAQADAALARIEAGDATLAGLAAERGLTLDDLDMGDVTREALGAAGEPVFALTQPGLVGPVDTPLGPALFQMNAILPARETPFETAAPTLRDELVFDQARRILIEDLDLFEDLLAGGATIAELVAETDMQGGQIDWRDGDSDGIAAYTAFREAAATLQVDDFPQVNTLDDGGLFALELVEILPAAPQPLDEIRTQVVADWRNDQIVQRLRVQADSVAQALRDGTATDLPLERFEGMNRTGFLPDLPRNLVAEVFALDRDEVRVVDGSARVHILQLHEIARPDTGLSDVARLRAVLQEQIAQSYAQDLFTYFAAALRDGTRIQLNQSVIDAVQAGFQ